MLASGYRALLEAGAGPPSHAGAVQRGFRVVDPDNCANAGWKVYIRLRDPLCDMNDGSRYARCDPSTHPSSKQLDRLSMLNMAEQMCARRHGASFMLQDTLL